MLKHFLRWPTEDEMLFAMRGVLAAALALWVALATGQQRPFWAPMATTIISLPVVAGSIFVRALSRFLGTCVGVVVAAFVLISFINYTAILCILTGVWISICLYCSMMKRTTSAYMFTVAGWTVPVIMTSVLSDQKFITVQYMMDIAVARGIETGIGFLSAVLAHSLFFPRKIGPGLVHNMDDVWDSMRKWTSGILTDKNKDDAGKTGLNAVQILSNLRVLTANLPFDVTNERWAINGIRLLQDRLTAMIPIVSSIEDNLCALRQAEKLSESWKSLLEDVSSWILQKDYSSASSDAMRRKIRLLMPAVDQNASWEDALLVRLAIDLERLVSVCEGCATRRIAIDDALVGRFERMPKKLPIPLSTLHKDYQLALFVAVAGGVSIATIMLIWVASGWNAGFCAPTMASIFFISFVVHDNSVRSLKIILFFTIIGLPAAYFYVLIVMYSTHSYEMLMMCFAPCLFVLGIFISRPPIRLGSTIFMMGIWSTTTMYDLDMANMTSFINGQGFAQCGGITLCLFAAMIFRSFDYEWTTKRLLREIRTDISMLAKNEKKPALLQSIVKMVDRVNLLVPRISTKDEEGQRSLGVLMRQMRIGINTARLRSMQSRLNKNGVDVSGLVGSISAYFAEPNQKETEKNILLTSLDSSIEEVCSMTSTVRKNAALAALAGIRRDLFPDTRPYYPQTLCPKEIV